VIEIEKSSPIFSYNQAASTSHQFFQKNTSMFSKFRYFQIKKVTVSTTTLMPIYFLQAKIKNHRTILLAINQCQVKASYLNILDTMNSNLSLNLIRLYFTKEKPKPHYTCSKIFPSDILICHPLLKAATNLSESSGEKPS
jgi:hypothetical protein